MSNPKDKKKKTTDNQKPSLLNIFLTKEKPDKTYFPELKEQWKDLNRGDKIKFILGALVGLIIITGALALVYYLLVLLRG
jgi:hypothetical protein